MEDTVLHRIRTFLESKSESQVAIAAASGIRQNTLSRQISGASALSEAVISSIIKYFPDLSAEWLMTGEGSMLKSKGSTNDDQQELIAELKEEIIALNAENKILRELAGLAERKESKSKSA